MKSIQVDVRPAMFDNFFGLYARMVVMPFKRLVGMTTFQPLSFFASKSMIKGGVDKATKLQTNWIEIENKCQEIKLKLDTCDSDEECGAAAVALQRCTASVVCPSIVVDFDKCISNQSDDEVISKSYTKMTDCLDNFEIECRSAK